MKDLKEDIEDFLSQDDKKQQASKKWPAFIGSEVLNFFNQHGIDKMTLEDSLGNKAKLTRQKNEEIKVETSSTTMY